MDNDARADAKVMLRRIEHARRFGLKLDVAGHFKSKRFAFGGSSVDIESSLFNFLGGPKREGLQGSYWMWPLTEPSAVAPDTKGNAISGVASGIRRYRARFCNAP